MISFKSFYSAKYKVATRCPFLKLEVCILVHEIQKPRNAGSPESKSWPLFISAFVLWL